MISAAARHRIGCCTTRPIYVSKALLYPSGSMGNDSGALTSMKSTHCDSTRRTPCRIRNVKLTDAMATRHTDIPRLNVHGRAEGEVNCAGMVGGRGCGRAPAPAAAASSSAASSSLPAGPLPSCPAVAWYWLHAADPAAAQPTARHTAHSFTASEGGRTDAHTWRTAAARSSPSSSAPAVSPQAAAPVLARCGAAVPSSCSFARENSSSDSKPSALSFEPLSRRSSAPIQSQDRQRRSLVCDLSLSLSVVSLSLSVISPSLSLSLSVCVCVCVCVCGLLLSLWSLSHAKLVSPRAAPSSSSCRVNRNG